MMLGSQPGTCVLAALLASVYHAVELPFHIFAEPFYSYYCSSSAHGAPLLSLLSRAVVPEHVAQGTLRLRTGAGRDSTGVRSAIIDSGTG